MDFKQLFGTFNDSLTFFVIFPVIVLLGLYLTVKLRFLQIFKLKMSVFHLLKKDGGSGDISHYQAVSTVLAGNFGTGNISGMAVALTTGGPGALVWMWVMAFLGAAIQYASCLLGVKYRQIQDGEHVGGPMYYLSSGLGLKKLATLFSFFTVFGALAVGNFAQINSLALPLQKMGIHPLLTGTVMAFFVALVIIGGIGRVAKTASSIVPIMALIYLGSALFILGVHVEKLPAALSLLFASAFKGNALVGGALGFGMVKAISTGFDRGLFATDAGTGIVPLLQSGAKTPHPVVNGIVTLIAPFLVMIVCTATGLVLILTGAWETTLKSTNMVACAFERGFGQTGLFVVLFALILFSYTTILAWGCGAEKAIRFLLGRKTKWFYPLYVLLIPIGAVAEVDIVWRLADLSIALMLLTNLVGVFGLSKEVVEDTYSYFRN
jgi:AGCS family alanine or glycine:cation symporter